MRIQIASDLHFEIWKRFMPDPARQFSPDESRDLLILAGDITDGNRQFGVSFIRRELGVSPVILRAGQPRVFPCSEAGHGGVLARVCGGERGVLLPERRYGRDRGPAFLRRGMVL